MYRKWQHKRYTVSSLTSTKLSTWCFFTPSQGPFFMSLSLSSTLVTVILALTACFSSSFRIFSIAVGGDGYLSVQTSMMLSDSASISTCICFILFGCCSYLFWSMLFTLWRCHFLSLVTISWFYFLVVQGRSSQCTSSSILLVATISTGLLRLHFSLYERRWVLKCIST